MILDILKELQNEPKTNGKILILEKYKDNKTLQNVLKYSTDAYYQSGIKQIPDIQGLDIPTMTLDTAINELQYFYAGDYKGHAARNHLQFILESLNEDDREVFIRIIKKKLDCGVQGKTINKVFGKNFIAIEPYMRCSLTTKDTIKNITSFNDMGYAVSEVKMDGQYLNHVIIGERSTSSSRNGKVFDFHDFHTDDMIKLRKIVQKNDPRFDSGVVVMGEALVLDHDGNILPRVTGNGIIQKAGENTISHDEESRVIFVLWDIVPYDAFREGIWNVERKERRELLETALSELNSNALRMVKYKKVKNVREALLYNRELIADKEEGSVLKCEHGIWKSHTSPKQLKMKVRIEVDLRITGFKMSTEGKRKGLIGSIMCESSDGIVKVNVGTGFKEKDHEWTLKTITESMDMLKGKIITIHSNGITVDKNTGEYSMFIPAFVEFRFDKDTCDSFERIKEIQESYIDTMLESLGVL